MVLQLEPGQLAGGVGELAGRGIGGLLGGAWGQLIRSRGATLAGNLPRSLWA